MSTLLAPAATGHDDDLHHVTCCDDDIAMCGLDVTDVPWGDGEGEVLCPLCAIAEEEDLACPVPGCPGRRIAA